VNDGAIIFSNIARVSSTSHSTELIYVDFTGSETKLVIERKQMVQAGTMFDD